MNVVIYARYSCDNQREESIDGQIRECKQYADRNDMCIIGEYIDRAFSAKTDNRPEFQKMINDSNSKKFQAIVVWKLDRFARNRYDSARYKTILKKNMVEVISATEVISKGAEGIILEAVLEGYAEYYSADLSEKVIRGMTENALKCKYNGGNVPIGYFIDANKNYQIDKLTAPFVKDAFEMYDSNVTMKKITEYLNQKGVRTSKNKLISIRTMSTIFRNRKYIGEYKYRDIIVPNGIPQIINKNLFNRVQERLNNNQRNSNPDLKNKYILSSKLKCGNCNSFMNGESGTSKTGKIYNYYKCSSVKRHLGCDMKSIRNEDVEQIVLEKIIAYLFTDKNIDKITDAVLKINKKENASMLLLKKQHKCILKNINNIVEAITQGIFSTSVQEKLAELERQKIEIENQIKIEKKNLSNSKLSRSQIKYWLFNILTLLPEDKKSLLIDAFVDEIIYFSDDSDVP